MLIKVRIHCNDIAGLLGVPMSRNRFEQMSHFQLICICLLRWLHTPFFNVPELQRRSPRRNTENCRNITAADRIRNLTVRTVHTSFQPLLVGHACGIAKNNRCCH